MTTPTNAGEGVSELVAQREQLRAWIAKLDEVQTGAPSRVAQRVRADYQERLRRVTEELSAHAEEVQRSLESLRGELDAAEERRGQAVDALEEMRLRHLIGELDEPAWDRARAPLEQDVSTAEEAVGRTRGEVERLSVLSAEIGGGAVAEPEPESAGGDEDEEPDALPVFAYAPDEEAPDEEAAGEPEPAAAWEEPAAQAEAEPGLDAYAEPQPEAPVTAEGDEPDLAGGPVSGEELAAWISEVEAEASIEEEPAAAPPQPREDATDGWDPFANEFGGSPANPTTQPGDATQDLPWLDSIDGGAAGKWAAPRQDGGESDELAFLDNLEPAAPAESEAAASDLAADDLAFLEELDRAISGGGQRPAAPGAAPAQPAAGSLGEGFEGGSGGGGFEPSTADATEEQRKRGEALLCKECGAINEPQAWYCEICGSEL